MRNDVFVSFGERSSEAIQCRRLVVKSVNWWGFTGNRDRLGKRGLRTEISLRQVVPLIFLNLAERTKLVWKKEVIAVALRGEVLILWQKAETQKKVRRNWFQGGSFSWEVVPS